MNQPAEDEEWDPIPHDLTEEERRAVERQGRAIALQEELGVPRLTERDYDYGD